MTNICISSINGRESFLEQTINSLYHQADKIYICLNNYPETPEFLLRDKIKVIHRKNKYGDAYKFYWATKIKGYILTCDDDIIYPSSYVEYMTSGADKYGVVTLQGRNFDEFPIYSYYHRASDRTFCWAEQINDQQVQFGGTGVMCFHADLIRPDIKYFRVKNMADIWMGLLCREKGLKITSLRHPEGYVKPLESVGIWHEKHNADYKQVMIINEAYEN